MSKIKTLLLLISVLLCSIASQAAQAYRTTYSAVRNGVSHVNFALNDFKIQEVTLDGKTYSVITGAGEVVTGEKGYAALPFLNANLQLSPDKNISVTPEGSYEEISLKHPLLPSRGTIYRNQDPSKVPFEIDPSSITDSWYPGKVAENAEPFIFRDVRGANVYVYPFQYNAQKQTLRVYRNVKVTVAENNTVPVNSLNKVQRTVDPAVNDIYNSLFINYNKDSRFANQVGEFGEMLVLYTSRDATAILPYIEWKRQKGFKVTATQVATGTNVATTIKNAYTANPNLLYVQLVGDWADIKSPTVAVTTSADPTDPMMGCVVGTDKYPELMIGRFSCNSAAELTVQVNKAIEYEKNPDTNTTTNGWYKKALGIGSGEGSGSGDDGEADYNHMAIIKQKLLSYTYTTVAEAYQDPSVTAASTPINAGLSLINYCGHGSETSFVTTGYSNTNVNASTNGSKLPFIFSVACVNGAFHESSNCFAEAWLKKSGGGAVAVLMSTINQPWQPPMRGQDYFNDILIGGYTYSGSQSGTNTTAADQRTTFGSIALNGNVLMLAENASDASTIETIQTWTTFGDASLQIRTDIPKTLSVTPQPVVPGSAYSLTVKANNLPVKNALVSLYQNGNTYSALTNASGIASIAHSITTGTVKLTVTGYNTTTYQSDVLAGSAGAPTVSITAPANNATILAGTSVSIAASASDASKSVSKVDFYVDNVLKGTDTSSPYAYTWVTTGTANGVHTIKTVATDNDNKTGENSISVTVTDGKPTVAITAPLNNAIVNIGSTVNIAADALDPAKSVSKVDFYIDNVLKNSDNAAPYSYSWSTAGISAGVHSVKAVVTDNENKTSEHAISVTASIAPVEILNEGFEGTWVPAGWSVVPDPNGWFQSSAFPHTGTKCAAVKYNHTVTAGAVITTPALNISGSASLEFWWVDKDYFSKASGADHTYCEVSTNGTTWTQVAVLGDGEEMSAFEKVTVDLTPFQGSAVKIRWRDVTNGSSSAYGTGLDDVIVKSGTTSTTFAAPTNLSSSVTGSNVTLNWTAPAKSLSGYNIYRNNVKINTSAVVQTNYADNSLANGEYTYTIKAVYTDPAGESSASNSVTATVGTTPATSSNNPPPAAYTAIRTPAEFEPVKTVVLQWDFDDKKRDGSIRNLREYNNLHNFLVKNIQLAGAKVMIMVDNSSVQSSITSFLQSNGTPLTNVTFKILTTESIWCRDYSATSIYYGDNKQPGLVDWEYNRSRPYDDDSPVAVASVLNTNLFRADENSGSNKLVGTGGNFMTDGFGLAVSSKLIVNENSNNETAVKNIVKNYMGIDRYSLMNTLPYDDIHHIDMHIKLLDEETILVGQYANGVADGPTIESNLQTFLANYKTVYGRDFNVVRIPMLGNPANGDDYRTYTNSLIVNNYILVPIYGVSTDNTALQVYRDAMPGYTVVGYNCADIISRKGAIHCITHEVNTDEMIRIKHPRFITGIAQNQNLVLNAELWSTETVSSVKAYVKFSGQGSYTEYNMTVNNNGIYSASIPCASQGEARYYIKAQSANAVCYKPQSGATGGYYKVSVGPSSIDLDGVPMATELYQNYPNPFNPETSISFFNRTAGDVKLAIYNARGEEVSVLKNCFTNKGMHTVKFNAGNLNSGVYFYKLMTQDKTLINKMLLVK